MELQQGSHLNWNNHQSMLQDSLNALRLTESLVDCTLASAEGKIIKAHKIILSACSSYFAKLLHEQYDKHPIFILKDVSYYELRTLMDFMYCGEVDVLESELPSLIRVGALLQVKGFLCDYSTVPADKMPTQNDNVLANVNSIDLQTINSGGNITEMKKETEVIDISALPESQSSDRCNQATHIQSDTAHTNSLHDSHDGDQLMENDMIARQHEEHEFPILHAALDQSHAATETHNQIEATLGMIADDDDDGLLMSSDVDDNNCTSPVLIESSDESKSLLQMVETSYNTDPSIECEEMNDNESLLVAQTTTEGVSCKRGCGKLFKSIKTMRAHIALDCGKPHRFECAGCQKLFKRKHDLKRHFIKKHQKN